MRIYSNTLTESDLLRLAQGTGVSPQVTPITKTRVASSGWVVETFGNTRRSKNSGTHGASGESAASWDEHGRWFARIFDADPCAVIVAAARYEGRVSFHFKTKGKYSRPLATPADHSKGLGEFYDDPKRIEKGD